VALSKHDFEKYFERFRSEAIESDVVDFADKIEMYKQPDPSQFLTEHSLMQGLIPLL
jgi:hypothetical protein